MLFFFFNFLSLFLKKIKRRENQSLKLLPPRHKVSQLLPPSPPFRRKTVRPTIAGYSGNQQSQQNQQEQRHRECSNKETGRERDNQVRYDVILKPTTHPSVHTHHVTQISNNCSAPLYQPLDQSESTHRCEPLLFPALCGTGHPPSSSSPGVGRGYAVRGLASLSQV